MILVGNNKIGELNYGSPINKVYKGGEMVFSKVKPNYFEGTLYYTYGYTIDSLDEFSADIPPRKIIFIIKDSYIYEGNTMDGVFYNFYYEHSSINTLSKLQSCKLEELNLIMHEIVYYDDMWTYFIPEVISTVNVNDFNIQL